MALVDILRSRLQREPLVRNASRRVVEAGLVKVLGADDCGLACLRLRSIDRVVRRLPAGRARNQDKDTADRGASANEAPLRPRQAAGDPEPSDRASRPPCPNS